MQIIVTAVIAFSLGMVFWEVFHCLFGVSGTLKIDRTNYKKDVYRFEINNLKALGEKKYVILKVDGNADFSQE